MTELCFYFDENVDPIVAEQLQKHGIDAITVRDLDALGDTDMNHLERATELERVLCTHDRAFCVLRRKIPATAALLLQSSTAQQLADGSGRLEHYTPLPPQTK